MEDEQEAADEHDGSPATTGEEEVSGPWDGSHSFWLGLADLSAKEDRRAYGKDDLWLLSTDPLFGWRDPTQPSMRYNRPWVMFVLSEFRSFAERQGLMRVRLLAVEGTHNARAGRHQADGRVRYSSILAPFRDA